MRNTLQRILRQRWNEGWSREGSRALTALKCQVAYNKYGGYCVPESGRRRPACRAILANKVWEPRTIEVVRSECRNGDIIHAGAYFGDFLPAFSQALSPRAKLWAFEPSLENFRCAKITKEINQLANVELTRAALGARRMAARLKINAGDGVPLGGRSTVSPEGEEEIEVVTVDEAIGDREVSVIQLDVEDYEEQALEGAMGVIRRCRPVLVLEVSPGSGLLERGWLSNSILTLGYRIEDKVHDNIVLRC